MTVLFWIVGGLACLAVLLSLAWWLFIGAMALVARWFFQAL